MSECELNNWENEPESQTIEREWLIGDQTFPLGKSPWIMGIVNVTPDSFSDGNQFLDPQAAVSHALKLLDDGADILDIGGESSRPGAAPVDTAEELRRVLPVIERIRLHTDALISIDTTKAEVARQALDAGASIVNDISGLRHDPQMPVVCADRQAAVICMHMQGTPQSMQDDPRYDNVVEEIYRYLECRTAELEQQGIARNRIVVDPGIGFGKTADHNLTILANIGRFRGFGRPVLVGHSRKRFLSKVLGRKVEERLAGTVGIAIALAAQSTDIIRVHDVQATRDAIVAWASVAKPAT